MKEVIIHIITFSTLFGFIASSQALGNCTPDIIIFILKSNNECIGNTVHQLFLEDELILDLPGLTDDEWIIKTDPNHIFHFSLLTNDDDVDAELISSSLTVTFRPTLVDKKNVFKFSNRFILCKIMDADKPDSLLFPSETNQLFPFYSTENAVSVKLKSSSSLKPFRLKAEKVM